MEQIINGHKTEESPSWIKALCVVKFDNELGLVVERAVPSDALSETDLTSAAMLSFPESNCVEQDESQTFFFRLRLNESKIPLKAQPEQNRKFIFGFSHYIQRKDPTNPRGYFQKAFIILTQYYFCTFYRSLAYTMGSAYFKSESLEFLQQLYTSVQKWTPAVPGEKYSFCVIDKTLNLVVPLDFYEHFPQLKEKDTTSPKERIEPHATTDSLVSVLTESKSLCQFYEIPLPVYFKGVHLGLLWNLWELMITETPLLVVANKPEEASFVVGIIISLVFPLKFTGDYRPYVTLYDSDIKEYADLYNKLKQPPLLVIGACNPYFPKFLADFPAVLRLDSAYYKENKIALPSDKKLSYIWEDSGSRKYLQKVLKTKEKLLLKPQKEVLKQLRLGETSEEVAINDWLLRRHFRELTTFFLSIFKGPEGKKGGLKEMYGKETKFNTLYMKNRKKTQELYSKFVTTKMFERFLQMSNLFN